MLFIPKIEKWLGIAFFNFSRRATRDSDSMEIQKCDKPTDRQTWVGARDACASKNSWGRLSSTFHVERPETLIEWKFESITYLRTDGRTDGLTWVGARDTCVSKNQSHLSMNIYIFLSQHRRMGQLGHKNWIKVFSGVQGVEKLEKDHTGPQQNKHNPTFCLQGGQFLMMDKNILLFSWSWLCAK